MAYSRANFTSSNDGVKERVREDMSWNELAQDMVKQRVFVDSMVNLPFP
jgi:hypothetical protein